MVGKPRITVKLIDGQFQPCSAFDAEQLALSKNEQEFDLVLRSKRSENHHKLYWSILGKACSSTGKWPTSEHLHRELKMACGYYQTVASEFGGVYYFPDTISMEKMNQQDFNNFFESTMEKLSQAIGFDPMELLR
tara:strand:- start:287 stop:691 length:405 start_codon:yes stop_codon:yes gene_type:complete